MTKKLRSLWAFDHHRPAIGAGVLASIVLLQSVVAYMGLMVY